MPYRPERIGPHAMWDVNVANVDLTNTLTVLGNVTMIGPNVFLGNSVIKSDHEEIMVRTSPIQTIGANVAFFCGAVLLMDHHEKRMQYSVVGGCHMSHDGSNMNFHAFPFIGLLDNATVDTTQVAQANPMAKWMPLAPIGMPHESATVNCNVNESIVVEDTVDSAQLICAGFVMRNNTTVVAAVDMCCYISFQKYVEDVVVFDPPRS